MNLLEEQTLLQEGGFDQKDITAWKQGKIKELQQGGFTNQEISNEFKFEPDTKIVKDYVNNVARDYLSGRGIIISEEDGFFIIDFFAQTFLWNQIRRIVSALEKVGSDKLPKEQVIAALDNPDKKVDFGLAPAEPLILKDIVYDFDFEYKEETLKELDDFEKRILDSISL